MLNHPKSLTKKAPCKCIWVESQKDINCRTKSCIVIYQETLYKGGYNCLESDSDRKNLLIDSSLKSTRINKGIFDGLERKSSSFSGS